MEDSLALLSYPVAVLGVRVAVPNIARMELSLPVHDRQLLSLVFQPMRAAWIVVVFPMRSYPIYLSENFTHRQTDRALHHAVLEAIIPFVGSLSLGHFDSTMFADAPSVASSARPIIDNLTRNMCKAYTAATMLPYAALSQLSAMAEVIMQLLHTSKFLYGPGSPTYQQLIEFVQSNSPIKVPSRPQHDGKKREKQSKLESAENGIQMHNLERRPSAMPMVQSEKTPQDRVNRALSDFVKNFYALLHKQVLILIILLSSFAATFFVCSLALQCSCSCMTNRIIVGRRVPRRMKRGNSACTVTWQKNTRRKSPKARL